ncbi:hypothetical protein ASG40_09490 [Methylobacterium sp. Leaf399]|uniref:hypothetical protein n=1 Tax=unclassified Methylobacterium TaxID=2615210 RepID=UPI0006F47572|nr:MULTISPECIES: hypothetical protein [unclassified Methylobacterium]KQP55208.1 hypothetical protein ASF39_05730 [Methylobacterium sp. Leaf108]KQT09948.1 hypothetical protein ASG40_09490 [Methylobacterium sp. Leaf399]KQT87562.1 hypothetical protein ASG59_15930 [Methylobacterium sp. Leaf466]
MTPLVDTVLLLALIATSACVVPMYLKLKRLDRTQAEYGRIFAQSGQALHSAGEAVRGFSTEGREILEALTVKIDEARRTLSDLEESRRRLTSEAATSRDGHARGG